MSRKSAKIETGGDYSPGHVEGDYKIIYQASSEPEVSTEVRKAILEKYNFKLKQRFSTINLFGEKHHNVNKGQGSIARMADIVRGFVPLHLTEWQDDAGTQENKPLEIEELFFNNQLTWRFLLRGLPGSGKTTLLRYLVYRFAIQTLSGEKECIPVYLRAKYLNLNKTSLEEFVKQQINEDSDNSENFDVLCARSRFLESPMMLLFDGLDEIEDMETNERIAEALDDLVRQHPRCNIIVASRPIGLRRQNYTKYRPLDLLPLNQSMINGYLEKWFASDTEGATKLRMTIEEKQRIRALASNPFLLSMICYTFEQGGDTALIERRSTLYENCTKYLLQRLYDPESAANSKIDYKNTLAILKDLSLRFFLWQEEDFPVDYVNVIGRRILTAKVLGKAEKFLDRVQRETGLIQRIKGGFTFVHRSLWEYFTALALLEKKPDFVIRQAANPDWEEVVRLYAGLLPKAEDITALVIGLWNINRPLALRVTTETQILAAELIKPLIEKEEGNQGKLLLIDSLEQSLPLLPVSERQKLLHETFTIMLIDCKERDCEVIYYAQELLEKMGMQPLQTGGLIYQLFDLGHAAERQQRFLSDPANHFEWILVEEGSFWIGDDEHADDEKPAHQVKVDSFLMTKHPVTNHLLQSFPFGEKYPDYGEQSHPAIGNNWYEAYYFALWIGARLPTEAEWEYAARGGKYSQRTVFYFGDSVDELPNHAWFGESQRPYAHAVNEINPRTGKENLNPLGLDNMLGNIWEWCQDWYGRYNIPLRNDQAIENPNGPMKGETKILRGGGFRNAAEALRCTRRGDNTPDYRNLAMVGFRLVCPTVE